MRILILLAVPGVLLGCGASSPPRHDVVRDKIGDEIAQATTHRKSNEAADKALLAPLTIELPKQEVAEPRFDLSIVNAPAAQVFMAIVSGTRYNMLVGPEVAGNLTVNLKDVTVREALESIRELYGYEFTIKGNRIAIQPNTLQTRVFQVNYLASRRQGATELNVTASGISSPGTTTPANGATAPMPGNGSTQQVGMVSSRVQTSSDANFWRDLQTALGAIVAGEGRSIVVNSISGVVVVRAFPGELRAVEQYLKATQVMVERQVMLEAKILEVALNQGYQSGINWASFRGNTSIGVAQRGSVLRPSGSYYLRNTDDGAQLGPYVSEVSSSDVRAVAGATGAVIASALGNGFVGLAFQSANFAALLNFLETQGQVSVLSSPRIATINNQKAVLKVGTDEYFITRITGGSTTTSTVVGTVDSTPTVETAPFFSGISLDVTPQIDDEGNIILHVHPAITTVEQSNKSFTVGNKDYSLPFAKSSVNETDSIVRVQDGNIVAIGGLMTQSQTSDRTGLPGTVSSPAGMLLGQRGTGFSKRELVILLKPTVIHDDRAWVKDLQQSGERLRNFDLPPLSVPLQ